MGLPLGVSRIQREGLVTLPVEIRQRLGVEEGDLVAFIETDAGIVLSPQTPAPANMLDQEKEREQAPDNPFDRLFQFVRRRNVEAKPAGPSPRTGKSVAEITFAAFPAAAVGNPQEWRRSFMAGLANRTQNQSDQTDEA